ncbi:unnamed protein product [Polarella glacialis]|uniref:RING-type domain-containing protein n=1 Tax=Polarella glacialis TaxID=89957 RepID=A0A813FEJ2_POLGL|nr:unnamed protein product [Polarella glacialis]
MYNSGREFLCHICRAPCSPASIIPFYFKVRAQEPAPAAAAAESQPLAVAAQWWQCPICLENRVNRVNIQCGHTICNECKDDWYSAGYGFKCHICRKPHLPTSIIPMYFSS